MELPKVAELRTYTVKRLTALAKSLNVKPPRRGATKRLLFLLCADTIKWIGANEEQAKRRAKQELKESKRPKLWYAIAVKPRQEKTVRKRIRRQGRKEGFNKLIGKMLIPVDYDLKLQSTGGSREYWYCPKCQQEVNKHPNKRGGPKCMSCGTLIEQRTARHAKGQRRIITKTKRLPNYLLCRLSLTADVENLVKRTRGVKGFLPFGFDDDDNPLPPCPVSQEEVDRVCKPREGETRNLKQVRAKVGEYKEGDFVEVLEEIKSPWHGCQGVVKATKEVVGEGQNTGTLLVVEVKVLGCPTMVSLWWWMVKKIDELTKEE